MNTQFPTPPAGYKPWPRENRNIFSDLRTLSDHHSDTRGNETILIAANRGQALLSILTYLIDHFKNEHACTHIEPHIEKWINDAMNNHG